MKNCDSLSEENYSYYYSLPDNELLALLYDDKLTSHVLTFAAAVAGSKLPLNSALDILGKIALSHSSALAREGAIIGLSCQDSDSHIIIALFKLIIKTEENADLRLYCEDYISTHS